jgi:hypothetical protein
MNILLDTNILIPLEDTARVLDPRLAELRRRVDEFGFRLHIHPAQFDDLNRDRDQERKEIVLSRCRQYTPIPSPPELTEPERTRNGWAQSKDNDRVDNLLLHAVHRGAAHILISNDEGIRTKAARVGIQERVYRLDQALEFLARQRQPKPFQVPYGIRERYLHEFDVNAPFFDSLREGYAGFDDWYLRGSQARRRCWSIADDSGRELARVRVHWWRSTLSTGREQARSLRRPEGAHGIPSPSRAESRTHFWTQKIPAGEGGDFNGESRIRKTLTWRPRW